MTLHAFLLGLDLGLMEINLLNYHIQLLQGFILRVGSARIPTFDVIFSYVHDIV